MAPEFLIGQRIHLRGLKAEDIAAGGPYHRWMNDLSLDFHTERAYYPYTPEKMRAYFEGTVRYEDRFVLAICDNETGRHIGNIGLSAINWIHRRACIGYLIGEKEFAGRGIATDANLMFMYYGFAKLNFERIHASAIEPHRASRRVLEKAGMLEEGRSRRHLLRAGVWHDDILYGALREEWMATHGAKARALFAELPA